MTDGLSSPSESSAGWYPDAHQAGRLRYFDGERWTDHFHTPGKLPAVSDWIQSSFDVARRYGLGPLIVFFVAGLVGNGAALAGFGWALSDLGVVDDRIVGFDSGRLMIAIGIVLASIVVASVAWLMASSYFHRAHYQMSPSLGTAFSEAVRSLGRFLGNYLVVALGLSLLSGLVLGVSGAVSPLLLIVTIPIVIAVALFVGVKVGFLGVSAVLAPKGSSVLKASASVSDGRFWPIVGRILLAMIISIAVGMVGQIVTIPLGTATEATIEPGMTEFYFRDLFPSIGVAVAIGAVITQAIAAVSNTLLSSMWVRLYLDASGPRTELVNT